MFTLTYLTYFITYFVFGIARSKWWRNVPARCQTGSFTSWGITSMQYLPTGLTTGAKASTTCWRQPSSGTQAFVYWNILRRCGRCSISIHPDWGLQNFNGELLQKCDV